MAFMLTFFCFGSSALVLVLAFRWRLSVTEDSIISRLYFKEQKILFTNIEGFKIHEVYMYIIPKDTSMSRIKIEASFNGKADFYEWMQSNFKNLDEVE
jgi:hypothetical protein